MNMEKDDDHRFHPRTILNDKYLMGKVLNEDDFGITYVGWDLDFDIKVAIKEYDPTCFVTKKPNNTNISQFTKLAKYPCLPGIITVYDSFIEDGMVYIVMEYIVDQTLKSYLAEMGGRLPAAQVFDMMEPVIASLAQVHESDIIHGGINLNNILISSKGCAKLLGFTLEGSYHSIERKGPWVDVYGLSVLMYTGCPC